MDERLRQWWEKKFFRVAAYMAFAFVSFCVFFLWTFPDDRAREIAANHLEAGLDYEYDVQVGDIGFWRLTGLRARDIRLEERVPLDEDGQPEELGLTVQLDGIAARFSPIRSLLNRGPTVRFQIDVGGGVINGTVHQSGTDQVVRMSTSGLDLTDSTLLASVLGVPLFGVLEGDVELQFDGSRGGLLVGGHIEVEGERLTLGSTIIESEQIPFISELELPTTSFGNLSMKFDIEETQSASRIHFEEFETRGRDIFTEAWGHIDINPNQGRPELELRLQVNEDYVTEHDLGALFNIGEFREGEYDGWYGFALSGSFDNINFRGSRSAAQGPETAGEAEAGEEDGEE